MATFGLAVGPRPAARFFMLLALFIAAALPSEPVRIAVDVVEINHVLSEVDGRETLCQVVWWKWSTWHGEYKVCDWRLLEKCCRPQRIQGIIQQRWYDVKTQSELLVVAASFRETWTYHDVELTDRASLPERFRSKVGKE